MKITNPSLGVLSCLPPEVRIKIWKYLSPELHVAGSLPRKPDHFLRVQKILLTSRTIYDELAAEVSSGYDDDWIFIYVKPEYQNDPWIRVHKGQELLWRFKDLPDAIYRGFCDLPWHNLNVKVRITAPDRNDCAQIICLFKKAQALVEILKKGCLSLNVAFIHTKNRSWFLDGQPQESSKQIPDLSPLIIQELPGDSLLIVSLFIRIKNLKKAIIYSREIVEGRHENLAMDCRYYVTENIMMDTVPTSRPEDEQRMDKNMEKYSDQLAMLVEHIILYYLPSETSNILRRNSARAVLVFNMYINCIATRNTRMNSRDCRRMMLKVMINRQV